MENRLSELELEIKETISCVKILQLAIQNSPNDIFYENIDDNLEIVRCKLEQILKDNQSLQITILDK